MVITLILRVITIKSSFIICLIVIRFVKVKYRRDVVELRWSSALRLTDHEIMRSLLNSPKQCLLLSLLYRKHPSTFGFSLLSETPLLVSGSVCNLRILNYSEEFVLVRHSHLQENLRGRPVSL